MTSGQARASARDILRIVPLVMRTVAAELRAAGELPAPAHFGLLSFLAAQPKPLTLTELASRQGVSLPTMSNSITAVVGRGWVRRSSGQDRRQVSIEVTPKGRSTCLRVGRSAETHLAELLQPLDEVSRARLREGLRVMLEVFTHPQPAQSARGRKRRQRATGAPAEPDAVV